MDHLKNAKFDFEEYGSCDAQFCDKNILLVVSGNVTFSNSPVSRRFIQSFYLEDKSGRFFVRNSIFRTISDVTSAVATTVPIPAPVEVPKKHVATTKAALVQAEAAVAPVEAKAVQAPVVEVAPVAAVVTKVSPAATVMVAPVPEPVAAVVDTVPKSYLDMVKRDAAKSTAASAPPAEEKKVGSASNNGNAGHSKEKSSNANAASGTSVYVSSIPDSTNADMLSEVFSKFGKVVNIDINPGRGHAFVSYEKVDGAKACLDSAVPIMINATQLKVEKRTVGKSNNSSGGNGAKNSNKGGGSRDNNSGNGSAGSDKKKDDKSKSGSKNSQGNGGGGNGGNSKQSGSNGKKAAPPAATATAAK